MLCRTSLATFRFGEGEGISVQCCSGRRQHTRYAFVLDVRSGVPQIVRIKLIHKNFMDQLDSHVDFKVTDQLDP